MERLLGGGDRIIERVRLGVCFSGSLLSLVALCFCFCFFLLLLFLFSSSFVSSALFLLLISSSYLLCLKRGKEREHVGGKNRQGQEMQ